MQNFIYANLKKKSHPAVYRGLKSSCILHDIELAKKETINLYSLSNNINNKRIEISTSKHQSLCEQDKYGHDCVDLDIHKTNYGLVSMVY